VIAIAIICIVAWLGWTSDATLFGPMMIAGILTGVFFGMPVGLNLGYFWGTTFAKIAGIDASPREEAGEPPCVSAAPHGKKPGLKR
jgi:hypothetical protein